MKNYIGLDAHSATSTFVNLDWQGNMLSRACVKTSEKNLIDFISAQRGEKKLTFEQSGLTKWLYTVLKDQVDELIICNPVYLAPRTGPKNDYRDALHLADELRCKHLTPVYMENNELMNMRTLISSYTDVVRECVRAKNRYKALFRAEALKTKGKTLYKQPERIAELSEETNRFVAGNLLQQFLFLEETKQKYLKEFRNNMKEHKVLRNLASIPGIDVIRAHEIAALVCTADRFEDKHKLWAYSMLVKYTQESDGKIYGKKMIHGRKELKNVFLGAALSVLKGNSCLRKYYDRLRTKGLSDGKARYDVARKIAAISLAVMRQNRKFKDKYEEENRRAKQKLV
jgi:transposase